MACRRCGSDWKTLMGRDMASCPECCKQQRCKARKQGRLPPADSRECLRCGQSFDACGSSMSQTRYCSHCRPLARKECNQAAKERLMPELERRRRLGKMLAGFLLAVRTAMRMQGEASRRCVRDAANPPRVCPICGKPFWPDPRRDSRACSRECCKRMTSVLVCSECGQAFTSFSLGRKAKSSGPSPVCRTCVQRNYRRNYQRKRRKNGEHRKRCRRFGVPYDQSIKSHLVFERDRHRCHVCRRRTLRKFRWVDGKPHPLSPTIDHHPYPLSLGICGHEWHNVRCCCWSCNIKKKNSWDGQLPLSILPGFRQDKPDARVPQPRKRVSSSPRP